MIGVKNYAPVEGVELAKVYEVAAEMTQADREGAVKRDIMGLMVRRQSVAQQLDHYRKEATRLEKLIEQFDGRLARIAGGDWSGLNEPDEAA